MSAGNLNPKQIESIPPALFKTIPAAEPPPGFQPNFIDPPTLVPVILSVSSAFLFLSVLSISIRIYTKLAIAKHWRWDDLTCSLGFICSIVYYVTIVIRCTGGGAGRHQWDQHLDKILSKSSLYPSYIQEITVTPALGLIKSSLFIQYYTLFRPHRWLRICVWIGATISTLFYIPVSIVAFALTSPWPGESFLDDVLSWHYLKFSDFAIPTGVIGMLVDWYLLILPIPAVLALQVSPAKKLGILVIFMTGGLAAIASIVSLYYRVRIQNELSDPTWKVGYILLWSAIEMSAGVAASSMPTVNHFFTRQKFTFHLGSTLRLLHRSSRCSDNDDQEKLPKYNDSSFTELGQAKAQAHTAEPYVAEHVLTRHAPRVSWDPRIRRMPGVDGTQEQGIAKSGARS